jgi:hypothetical protein
MKPFGGGYPKLKAPRLQDLESFKFVESKVNGGMITAIDAADIPKNALQEARNARVRLDKTISRPGNVLVTPVKPDSNSVLGFTLFKDKLGTSYSLRFTNNSIHIQGSANWTALTGTLAGGDSDRFRFASVLDKFVFANNGIDNLQTIDFSTSSFAQLGNAPKYRYVTGFFNRVVGAARAGVSEVEVGWSGDGNSPEWDPITDESAGSSPIVESTSDLSDFITGIFGFTNVMILMREHSIWIATKQPVAQNPFNFICNVSEIGSDSPYSIASGANGLFFFDRRTGSVWYYTPGNQPERIGQPIDNTLVAGVDDPSSIFGSYSPINNEYTVCIPRPGSKLISTYTFNSITKAWVYDEIYGITSVNDTPSATATVTIDQLPGTINLLQGTIDELSPAQTIISTRFYGRNDGEIIQEDDTAITDPIHADQQPNPDLPILAKYSFETRLSSKVFNLPELDMYFAEIVIEYVAKDGGTFFLDYSKSGGAAGEGMKNDPDVAGDWVLAKTIRPNPAKLGLPQLFRFVKQLKCRRMAWRLRGFNSRFQILSYEVHAYPSGKSTK